MKNIFKEINMMNIGKMFRICFRNRHDRKKLKNKDFTILCNTCIGGVICHDLGQKFLSPTINVYIRPHDFVKFLENLEEYLQMEVVEIPSKLKYPVGKIGDIPLFFKHYKTFEDAKKKWNERKKRINYDNLYVMMTDRWCCPESDLAKFEKLPYKHKICFTAKKWEKYPSTRQVVKNNDDGVCVGVITFVANIFGKRLYQYAENFDYVEWINQK